MLQEFRVNAAGCQMRHVIVMRMLYLAYRVLRIFFCQTPCLAVFYEFSVQNETQQSLFDCRHLLSSSLSHANAPLHIPDKLHAYV